MPERIQRQRTKGWRMPSGAVYVGRPSVYGNPFRTRTTYYPSDPLWPYLARTMNKVDDSPLYPVFQFAYITPLTPEAVVEAYGWWFIEQPALMLRASRDLVGRDLCCWCPLTGHRDGGPVPCHVDFLLELVN